MSETELILFSGGPDSTILLKHFLQQKKNVRVLYIEMAWGIPQREPLQHQGKAVEDILDYMHKNYGSFQFSQSSIFTSLNEPNYDKYFATDNQWCALFGSMFCNIYNIPRMWTGNYSYTNEVVKERDGSNQDGLNEDDLGLWMNVGTRFEYGPPDYCTPRLNYKGKGIDKFKTKKEAWDSLEIDLKKLVRSCISGEWYCGECYKCRTSKKYGLRDDKGNPL